MPTQTTRTKTGDNADMIIHSEPHPKAGQVVPIKLVQPHHQFADIKEMEIEDYWDRVSGGSWMNATGNPACLIYAVRTVGLPIDDEVLYGKTKGRMGVLIHVSELGDN